MAACISSPPPSVSAATRSAPQPIGSGNPLDLTIIITTSPIVSNPSLSLLTRTLSTFHYGGPSFDACPRLIVCDGYRDGTSESTTKKHSTPKSAMRSGIVDAVQRSNYEEFKARLRSRVAGAGGDPSSPFRNCEVLELPSRHGYGYALKAACESVETKYVCVVQHDRTFMREAPVEEVVKAMEGDGRVKYVGFLMRR